MARKCIEQRRRAFRIRLLQIAVAEEVFVALVNSLTMQKRFVLGKALHQGLIGSIIQIRHRFKIGRMAEISFQEERYVLPALLQPLGHEPGCRRLARSGDSFNQDELCLFHIPFVLV